MSANKIPHLSDDLQNGPDGVFEDQNGKNPLIGLDRYHYNDEDMSIWDNTLRDGLEDFEVYETIQKIRNYYNGHHNIDGRPPSKKDFNDYLDSLQKV
jgi:hypothetical protein